MPPAAGLQQFQMTAPIMIIIEDYNPFWPQQFETLRLRVAQALGPLAVSIEHVGSTAVPGLASKPTIDVDVLLRSADDLRVATDRLFLLGYLHRGDLGIPGREAFRAPLHDVPHHLYVCSPGYGEYERHIAFRDHLRNHPDDAKAYAALKRELARRYRNDREAYTEAKSGFVNSILERVARNRGTF